MSLRLFGVVELEGVISPPPLLLRSIQEYKFLFSPASCSCSKLMHGAVSVLNLSTLVFTRKMLNSFSFGLCLDALYVKKPHIKPLVVSKQTERKSIPYA